MACHSIYFFKLETWTNEVSLYLLIFNFKKICKYASIWQGSQKLDLQ